ncbi:hypothetical protein LTR84_006528 [Exophiala bonariae]|uniref:Zn(2)-C6 fungal-type domain-containing protein n=1 Tax=Exophiala bonariae TaxID=1690606 RepID=A0AAV9N312_9EURO|nr:hypothetical protein LTR84_006528 [Exophiala bonariae]
MSRRSHRKSRTGCDECKKKHRKCDEDRPICANCRTAEIRCSFLDQDTSYLVPAQASARFNSRPTSALSNEISNNSSPSQPQGLKEPSDPYALDMTHLRIFNNIYSKEFLSFEPQDQISIVSSVIFNKYILPTPYLMHETLAFSALHMSIQSPHSCGFYRDYATGLQTRALALFNDKLPVLDLNPTNCTPIFLFASFLAAHLLSDTLYHETINLDHFIEKFTHCLTIHHGVTAITNQYWDLLRESELGPRLNLGAELMRERDVPGSECAALKDLIDGAPMHPDLQKIYHISIVQLQKVFDAEQAYPSAQFDSQLVSAWPIMISPEYVDLLRQQAPEALIILAHYAVLLHRCRDSWLYGGGGKFLLESICSRLGDAWHQWLNYPMSVLLDEHAS